MNIEKKLCEAGLEIYHAREYQKQMPKNKLAIHEIVKSAIDSKAETFYGLASILGIDRKKVYRIYYGWDVDELPSQWADEELEYLKKNYRKMHLQEIADNLKRPITGVSHKVYSLKLRTLANPAANG